MYLNCSIFDARPGVLRCDVRRSAHRPKLPSSERRSTFDLSSFRATFEFDLRHSTFVFTSFGVRRTRTKRQPFGEGALVERGVADFKLIVFVIEYATIGGAL